MLLKQEELVVNHKRTERIYREEGFSLRRCRKKQRITQSRKPEETASGHGECLSKDFVHDNLADGRSIRILSLIDLWDRSCPMLTVVFSKTGQGVNNALNRTVEHGRMPRTLRACNSPEFTCHVLQIWAEKKGMAIEYTRPGKPTDNAHIESFNGRLLEECLNQHIFSSLGDAEQKIEASRHDYNQVRPHGSLGWLTPVAYKEKDSNKLPGTDL